MTWIYNDGPVGEGELIKPGDCISSLAVSKGTGLMWKDIWNHADNAELKSARMHPNILLPGDKVTIPKKKEKEKSKKDKKLYRWRLKGVPGILRLRFTKFGQPRKGQAYRLDVDNRFIKEGKLDDDGALEATIRPGDSNATVLLGKDKDNMTEEFKFKLGWIAPANEPRGVQTRLWNLNYYHGELSDDFDDETERALLRFMQKNAIGDTHKEELRDLKWDNLIGPQTEGMSGLVKAHGC